jgi:hypothetical protein
MRRYESYQEKTERRRVLNTILKLASVGLLGILTWQSELFSKAVAETGLEKYSDSDTGSGAPLQQVEVGLGDSVETENGVTAKAYELGGTKIIIHHAAEHLRAAGLRVDQPRAVSLDQTSGVAFHHSAGSSDPLSTLKIRYNPGTDRHLENPPYNLIVGKDGAAYMGTEDLGDVAYHTGGTNNDIYVGICAVGNFEQEEMGDVQKQGIIKALAWAKSQGIGSEVTYHSKLASTACPGRNFRPIIESGEIEEGALAIVYKEQAKLLRHVVLLKLINVPDELIMEYAKDKPLLMAALNNKELMRRDLTSTLIGKVV